MPWGFNGHRKHVTGDLLHPGVDGEAAKGPVLPSSGRRVRPSLPVTDATGREAERRGASSTRKGQGLPTSPQTHTEAGVRQVVGCMGRPWGRRVTEAVGSPGRLPGLPAAEEGLILAPGRLSVAISKYVLG